MIELHIGIHPGFGAEDLVKLLHQGVFGADHFLSQGKRFLQELKEEWRAVDPRPFPGEALFEPVDPLERTYRLNLRPAKRKGVDPESLGELLLSQPRKGGSREEFARRLELAVELAAEGLIPFSPQEIRGHGDILLETGVLPRHSAAYRRANRPHYRLVNDLQHGPTREALRSLGLL